MRLNEPTIEQIAKGLFGKAPQALERVKGLPKKAKKAVTDPFGETAQVRLGPAKPETQIRGQWNGPVQKAWETDASKLTSAPFTLRQARFGSRALKTETGAASEKLHVTEGKPSGGYDPTSYERLGGTHKDAPPGAATRANRNKAGRPGVIGRDLHFRAAHKLGFNHPNPRHGRYYDIDPGWRGTTP